jgi:hypothetical protein
MHRRPRQPSPPDGPPIAPPACAQVPGDCSSADPLMPVRAHCTLLCSRAALKTVPPSICTPNASYMLDKFPHPASSPDDRLFSVSVSCMVSGSCLLCLETSQYQSVTSTWSVSVVPATGRFLCMALPAKTGRGPPPTHPSAASTQACSYCFDRVYVCHHQILLAQEHLALLMLKCRTLNPKACPHRRLMIPGRHSSTVWSPANDQTAAPTLLFVTKPTCKVSSVFDHCSCDVYMHITHAGCISDLQSGTICSLLCPLRLDD